MEWIEVLVRVVFLVLGTVVTLYVVPWLKEKKIYDVVVKHVKAAEKLAQTSNINKKDWVLDKLTEAGIAITPAIDTLIECAVQELDIALGKIESKKDTE